MKQKHTNLPWSLKTKMYSSGIVSSTKEVADTVTVISSDKESNVSKKEADANAEFIVRACNSHYDLVEALEAMTTCYTDAGAPPEAKVMAYMSGVAALAKAKGDQS